MASVVGAGVVASEGGGLAGVLGGGLALASGVAVDAVQGGVQGATLYELLQLVAFLYLLRVVKDLKLGGASAPSDKE